MGYNEYIVSIPLIEPDNPAFHGPKRIIVRAVSEAHARERGAAQLGVDPNLLSIVVNPGSDGTGDIGLIRGPYG